VVPCGPCPDKDLFPLIQMINIEGACASVKAGLQFQT